MVPLAPRKDFPEPGERGCAIVFTDAAREEGTGFGGFTFISEQTDGGAPAQTMVFMAEAWGERIRDHLVSNELSMPAGEAIGAVALIDAVAHVLRGLTNLVVYTGLCGQAAPVASAEGTSLVRFSRPGICTANSCSSGWRVDSQRVRQSICGEWLWPAGECDELIGHAITLPPERIPTRGCATHPPPPHAPRTRWRRGRMAPASPPRSGDSPPQGSVRSPLARDARVRALRRTMPATGTIPGASSDG